MGLRLSFCWIAASVFFPSSKCRRARNPWSGRCCWRCRRFAFGSRAPEGRLSRGGAGCPPHWGASFLFSHASSLDSSNEMSRFSRVSQQDPLRGSSLVHPVARLRFQSLWSKSRGCYQWRRFHLPVQPTPRRQNAHMDNRYESCSTYNFEKTNPPPPVRNFKVQKK